MGDGGRTSIGAVPRAPTSLYVLDLALLSTPRFRDRVQGEAHLDGRLRRRAPAAREPVERLASRLLTGSSAPR